MDSRRLTNSLEFKVVVLGDKSVGKTSLVLRYIEGTYSNNYQPTIGAFFLTKKVTSSDGTAFKMQLWDTAGQERFRAMAPMYYRNSSAAVVCFDITNEDSFVCMKDWVDELFQQVRMKYFHITRNFIVYLVYPRKFSFGNSLH
jgi:small GTP-binding protein